MDDSSGSSGNNVNYFHINLLPVCFGPWGSSYIAPRALLVPYRASATPLTPGLFGAPPSSEPPPPPPATAAAAEAAFC